MTGAPSTSEADRVPKVDDSEMYWYEATSKNGKKYRVGVRKSNHPDLSEQEAKELLGVTKQGHEEDPAASIASISGFEAGEEVILTSDEPIY